MDGSKEENVTLTEAPGMPLELLLMTHTVKSHATSSVAPLAKTAALAETLTG